MPERESADRMHHCRRCGRRISQPGYGRVCRHLLGLDPVRHRRVAVPATAPRRPMTVEQPSLLDELNPPLQGASP